jgi:GT2 family glycosyltransferase
LVEGQLAALRDQGIHPVLSDLSLGASGVSEKQQSVAKYVSQLHALSAPGKPGYLNAFEPERYWFLRQESTKTHDEGASDPPNGDERVGAVVLTHNRAAEVLNTITQLVALPERPRIVVVDNGSADETADLLRSRFPAIQCVKLPTNLGAAGRNFGVQACDRPYVALCDDDTWWEPGSLSRAADLMDRYPSLAVISGRVLVGESERVDPTCLAMAKSPVRAQDELPGASLLGFLAGAALVRRSAFIEAGGFEPRLFLGGEERLLGVDLASAGWGLAYVDDVVIHHYPSGLRDANARRRFLLRNALWFAWLRRPLPRALAETVQMFRRAVEDAVTRRALVDALRGAPWVLRSRRLVAPGIELDLQRIERQAVDASVAKAG